MPWKTESAPGSGVSPSILAILSLMLLTFLGLTLATTTSTELQIATNYRWSQQALYNAEAGLEAARIVLSNVADIATRGPPAARARAAGPWLAGRRAPPGRDLGGRDFYRSDCDDRGGWLRPGRVTTGPSATRTWTASQGQTLNGAFTIWIRRPLRGEQRRGVLRRHPQRRPVVVAEGVAPYTGPGTPSRGRARRFACSRPASRSPSAPRASPAVSASMQGQEGGSPMGENFNPCANVTPGARGSLEGAFGGAGAGGLTSTGVQWRTAMDANRVPDGTDGKGGIAMKRRGLALGRRSRRPPPPRCSRSASPATGAGRRRCPRRSTARTRSRSSS